MTENQVKTIAQAQIEQLQITPTKCIEWAREAFLLKDDAHIPAKMSVVPQGEDFITSMPCLLPECGGKKYFGIKVVSRIKGQVPTLQSTISLYNACMGNLLAIVDGNWITAMRTGAVAALAADLFQRKDSNTYSIIGLGNIARAVALCLMDNNKHRQIKIRLMRYKNQAEAFIERFKGYKNVSFEIIDDKDAFVGEADVLFSCVTVATELLFPNDALYQKGMTLIPVHTPGFQNCDLFFDKVFGDDTGQIQRFKYFNRFRAYDELHHVLQGKSPGRTDDDERILSYNYGLALHDVFFATKIYELLQDASDGFIMTRPDKKIWL